MNQSEIFLCAGGTGGHLFPALSVARKLLEENSHLRITLVSDKRIQERGIESIQLTIPRRSNKRHLPLFVLALMVSFLKCFFLFLKRKPDLVVGFGGYPSVPAVLAAQMLRIPTLLHEQNAYMGRANRYLLKRAQLVALSFEKTEAMDDSIPHILTGNPVRLNHCTPYVLPCDRFNVLVIGGSQGAAAFSTLLPKALASLSPEERSKIALTQQCRPEYMEATQKAYDMLGMQIVLKSFFDNMQELYEQTHFIIARSGASTVCEVTVAGRPALFIPYPYAMDNHQFYNAKALEGACFLYEQKDLFPEKLAQLLRDCLQNPSILEKKAKDIQNGRITNASTRLAQVIRDLLPPIVV